MKPFEIAFAHPESVLPGAQFGDAYAMTTSGQRLDALSAARRAIDRAPSWINWLLRLRNMAVAPLRLKPGVKTRRDGMSGEKIGIFPILSQSPARVVLGLDDRHLDFRLLVDVEDLGEGRQSVTASTVVKTHNWLGRIYLALVKPFHRIIVRAMLAKVGG
jgi:Protein of unknown function (DUF2867)